MHSIRPPCHRNTKLSQHDLFLRIKVCFFLLCFRTAAFSLLANSSSLTTAPWENVNREICDIFNGITA